MDHFSLRGGKFPFSHWKHNWRFHGRINFQHSRVQEKIYADLGDLEKAQENDYVSSRHQAAELLWSLYQKGYEQPDEEQRSSTASSSSSDPPQPSMIYGAALPEVPNLLNEQRQRVKEHDNKLSLYVQVQM